MNKKSCDICGAEIYEKAVICPYCGALYDADGICNSLEEKTSKPWSLLTSAITGGLYLILSLMVFSGNGAFLSVQVSSLAIVHIILVAIGVSASITAVLSNVKTAALLSGIFLSVSVIFWINFGVFLLPSIVFAWIGFATHKEHAKKEADPWA